jgi:hypothetical protein
MVETDSRKVRVSAPSVGQSMADQFKPTKFSVPTVAGDRQGVHCPICRHDEFLNIVPNIDRAQKEGFRNVIMGLYGSDGLAALPVNVRYCANCGHVLNFIIGKFPQGDQT